MSSSINTLPVQDLLPMLVKVVESKKASNDKMMKLVQAVKSQQTSQLKNVHETRNKLLDFQQEIRTTKDQSKVGFYNILEKMDRACYQLQHLSTKLNNRLFFRKYKNKCYYRHLNTFFSQVGERDRHELSCISAARDVSKCRSVIVKPTQKKIAIKRRAKKEKTEKDKKRYVCPCDTRSEMNFSEYTTHRNIAHPLTDLEESGSVFEETKTNYAVVNKRASISRSQVKLPTKTRK